MAETIDATCFRCKACNNKIAMSQDYIRRDARTALFKKVVNVQTADPKDNWKRKGCTLANVFCGTHSCNKALGFRIVSAPHQKLIEGRVVLSLDRLMYWNGKKHSNPHLVHPENRFLFEFDETVVPHFYACRKCFAHIANSKDFISKINNLGWFKDVRNLLYNNSESRCENFVSGGTLRNEYCANCFSHLGGKIVAMKTPNPPLKEGNFLLMLAMLWYWNGEMMCDAEDHLMPAMNMQDPYLLLEGRTSEL